MVVLMAISRALVMVSRFMLGLQALPLFCNSAACEGRLGTWMNPATVPSLSLRILCMVWKNAWLHPKVPAV